MSAIGIKRTFQPRPQMSAFGGKADMALNGQNVRFREETASSPNTPINAPITTKLVLAVDELMPTIQGHTISHAASMTLIHSSHERKTVSVSNSAKITKTPEITAVCVAVESRSNRRAHGEMHNQRPNSQVHQSSHCFGSENSTAIVAPVKSGIPKNL